MSSANDLSAGQLSALLHFYAEAGVEWMLEEEAVDRFAEFDALKSARRTASAAAPQSDNQQAASRTSPSPRQTPQPDRAAGMPQPAIPDGEAVQQARFAAETARSLTELKTAIEAFDGCNLKRSARSTIFASGDAASGIMLIGSGPGADDDREGAPFAGRPGQLLDKMLAAIGLDRAQILLTQVIPWRPPGNRVASSAEMEICRPFIERQIALAEPKVILLLGNFAARVFLGENDTIHGLRGQWREIAAGGHIVPAIATLHPQDLLTAPINKRLAWNDLLELKRKIADL
ncbi:uracil-DNA glycosylase [Rhizobium grahamii]|uniref:Type-4 uracil-DNA glycosylase n=1 Tax=Rhizobium grahamii TaxID=1120045 RepID=A0A5Q0CAH1_9HYPH|nr:MULTISPECIES: uracil-DNA glycosylase [Rhizobium]QFY62345.1 uracil-DNA glycosylase [Rhizobium grahamii]QRM51265.1 uracil-DNA glycosylase [Rhizobium sp. BG6]